MNDLSQADRQSRQAAECYRHLERLAFAFQDYVLDHNGKLPEAQVWADALRPYVKDESVFHCPSDPSSVRCSSSMNLQVSGQDIEKISQKSRQTVLLFETAHSGRNPFGGKAEVIAPGRHYRYTNPNPGMMRFNTLSDLDQGGYYLFVGGWQPAYVLQARSTDTYLEKGILAGKEADHFRW